MDIEPVSGQMWKMNGAEIDYSIINCPADWLAKLDPDYLCLPKNTESGSPSGLGLFGDAFVASGDPGDIADPPAGTADFTSVPFWCGNNGEPGADGKGCGGLCGNTGAGFTCADQDAGRCAVAPHGVDQQTCRVDAARHQAALARVRPAA